MYCDVYISPLIMVSQLSSNIEFLFMVISFCFYLNI
jgi:hypothetical protein